MIYRELLKSQPVYPGCRGGDSECRPSTRKLDRSVDCSKDSCLCLYRNGRETDRENLSCLIYIAQPAALSQVNRQIRKEFSLLYGHATNIHMDFSHAEDFLYGGITEMDLRHLQENQAEIHITFDLDRLLADDSGEDSGEDFWNRLVSWIARRKSRDTPGLKITYDIADRAPQGLWQLLLRSNSIGGCNKSFRKIIRLPPSSIHPDYSQMALAMQAIQGSSPRWQFHCNHLTADQIKDWDKNEGLVADLGNTISERYWLQVIDDKFARLVDVELLIFAFKIGSSSILSIWVPGLEEVFNFIWWCVQVARLGWKIGKLVGLLWIQGTWIPRVIRDFF